MTEAYSIIAVNLAVHVDGAVFKIFCKRANCDAQMIP